MKTEISKHLIVRGKVRVVLILSVGDVFVLLYSSIARAVEGKRSAK